MKLNKIDEVWNSNTVNARISARGAYLIFYGERGVLIRRGALIWRGRLFHLFRLKMTLSLFLFKTKVQHKNSKTL